MTDPPAHPRRLQKPPRPILAVVADGAFHWGKIMYEVPENFEFGNNHAVPRGKCLEALALNLEQNLYRG